MTVLLTERQGAVLTVTLNRPDRMNALDLDLLDALTAAWDEARDPAVRAVIVTGAGRGFCAGADLRRAADAPFRPGGLRGSYIPMIMSLSSLEKPVIAALNGPSAGAGLSLALAADLRVAVPTARLVPAFVRIGVIPDAGATWFAVRALGYSAAFEWLTSGRELSAEEALTKGLVAEVTTADDLLDRAMQRAQALAAMPGRSVGLTKVALNGALLNTLATQLELEATLQHQAVSDPARMAAREEVAARIAKTPPAADHGQAATAAQNS
jgi:2-(1,2-epoxy-1,2-dihydrophenyl)acetyl-CoA isomerase